MDGTGAQLRQGPDVLGRGIALVTAKAVARIEPLVLQHQTVALHFGDDGGGGDGEAAAVASDERLVGQGQVSQRTAVHEDVVRRRAQLLQRQAHRVVGGDGDADGIDDLVHHHTHAHLGAEADGLRQPLTGAGAEQLAIAQFPPPGGGI